MTADDILGVAAEFASRVGTPRDVVQYRGFRAVQQSRSSAQKLDRFDALRHRNVIVGREADPVADDRMPSCRLRMYSPSCGLPMPR